MLAVVFTLGLCGVMWDFSPQVTSASRGPPDFSRIWDISLGPASGEGGRPRIVSSARSFFAAWIDRREHVRVARISPKGSRWAVSSWWVSKESTCAAPDLASNGRRLAIVYRVLGRQGEPSLHLLFLDAESGEVLPSSVEHSGSLRGAVAWSDRVFGLVWETPGLLGSDLRFQRFREDGGFVEDPITVAEGGDEPAIAGIDGGFAVAWHSRRDDHLYLTRIGPVSPITNSSVRVDELGPADKPAVCGGDREIGVSWHCVRWGKDWVFFRPFSLGLEALAPERLAGREGSEHSSLVWVGTAYAMVHDTPSQKMPDDVCLRWLDRMGQRGRGASASRSPAIASLEPGVAWNGEVFGIVWNERGGEGAFQSANVAVMRSRSDLDADGYLVFQIQDRQRWSGGDCNDRDPAVHPGADERCNGIDDDCDGSVDEGCSSPRNR